MELVPSSLRASHALVRIPGDGNCFFRSISLAAYGTMDKHMDLRKFTMASLMRKKDTYAVYFESPAEFAARVEECKESGKWNTDIIDLAPDVLADLINSTIVIHNYRSATDTFDEPIVFSGGQLRTVHVVRVYNCHYHLLLPTEVASTIVNEEQEEEEVEEGVEEEEEVGVEEEDEVGGEVEVSDDENCDKPETDSD
jgi:hypothetical protein